MLDIFLRRVFERSQRSGRDVTGSRREVVHCGVGCGGVRAGETARWIRVRVTRKNKVMVCARGFHEYCEVGISSHVETLYIS